MNWFSNILPRINKKKREGRAAVPEGVWQKCPQCGAQLFSKTLAENLWVCPTCDFHHRLSAEDRMRAVLDQEPAPFEIGGGVRPVDFLRFKDGKNYSERLQAARGDDDRREALRVWRGAVEGRAVVCAIFDFGFMGGSMGSVVGERFARAAEVAAERALPFICFTASGGARMQEGLTALLQMGKSVSALSPLNKRGLPFITVLCDPTTGGVAASFAMIGDVVLAEPSALVGFAGPRVIQETVREQLPDGFQRSEFLLQHGAVDKVVHRRDLRATLAALVSQLTAHLRAPAQGEEE